MRAPNSKGFRDDYSLESNLPRHAWAAFRADTQNAGAPRVGGAAARPGTECSDAIRRERI